ncbi:MAG: quinol:cytochrome C oxidoreductase [Candidatus Krumholzibacteriia bacterium]|nr:quinol:cytochrome C oxidoreductase [bacterium]MCB9514323.1 quinol:cytochrome C oxidoreductase [Candidatus Latescibacterota bacterium]MCB9516759.1 quinol:cytochrome C oxidoreductase [Candidatus Latescibacterota bacterium]
MGAHRRPPLLDIQQENRHLGDWGRRTLRIAAVLAVLGLAASLALGAGAGDGWQRFGQSYLLNFAYFLSLSLGALFFVLIQHVTGATWSVVVRRLAEAIATNLPWLGLLAIPILLMMGKLYHWTDAAHVAHDPLLQGKAPYLNKTFFMIRMAVYFLVWTWLSRYYYTRSTRQDASGDIAHTHAMQRLSGPGLVIFAITSTFAAVDLLMSLEPHWFSTIFGVYYFAGSAVGCFALLALWARLLQRGKILSRAITREHYHDLGKLVFAFIVFWAYIAFSQYMLIWYANVPEETVWYLARQTGQWTAVSVLLLFGHFFAPFLGLLSRYPKRQMLLLMPGALWVLFMHWVDLYWLVMPTFSPERVPLHWLDLTLFVGLGGLSVSLVMLRLRSVAVVPERDPRLAASLEFENA